MVVQEIDLVHVEEVPVGPREDAAFELALSGAQDVFDIEAARDPVLGGVQGELDDGHASRTALQFPPFIFLQTRGAHETGVVRAAVELASGGCHLGEDGPQGPDRGGFRGSLLSFDEDAADGGIHDVEEKCAFHLFLSDDPDEREAFVFGSSCYIHVTSNLLQAIMSCCDQLNIKNDITSIIMNTSPNVLTTH